MKITSTTLILSVFSRIVLCADPVDLKCFTDICTLGSQYCNTLPHVMHCRSCSDMDDYCLYNNKSEQCLLIACKAKEIANLKKELQKTMEETDSNIKILRNETILLEEKNFLLKQELKDGKLQLEKSNNETNLLKEENSILKQELKDRELQLEKSLTNLYIVLGVGISLIVIIVCIIIAICVKRRKRENKSVYDHENPRASISSTTTDTNESCEELLSTEKTEGVEMKKCEREFLLSKATAPPMEHSQTFNYKDKPILSSSDSDDSLTPSKSTEKSTNIYNNYHVKASTFYNSPQINSGSMHDQNIYKNPDNNTKGCVEQTPTTNITNETKEKSKSSRQTQEETRFPVQAAEHNDSNVNRTVKVVGTLEI